jgi:hypothetical protein
VKRRPLVLAAVLTLAITFSLVAVIRAVHPDIKIKIPAIGPSCTVRAGGEVTLDLVQMANAATIAAVGSRRDMPQRAITVALATALQESKLENLEAGDRDSVGLFQQRPSQGWGSARKLRDPRYAADKFYTALKKVKGWQSMSVTDAAQKVQRSAFPNAYAKWSYQAEVLAKALSGDATAAVACTLTGRPALRGAAAAAALLKGLKLDWGKGLDQTVERGAGLTVAVGDPSAGWRYAHWLVSHAHDTGLERVRFADLEWRADAGTWQSVTGDGGTDERLVIAQVFA